MSMVDQLKKLAARLESGEITREEFDEEKAKLLGLSQTAPTTAAPARASSEPSRATHEPAKSRGQKILEGTKQHNSEPSRSCYNCSQSVSIYTETCTACGAALQAKPRPAPPPPAPGRQTGTGTTSPPDEEFVDNIRLWLAQNGLPQYIALFEEQGIDGDVLSDGLTDTDLQSIGITKLGDRKRLLKLITGLKTAGGGKSKERKDTPKKNTDHTSPRSSFSSVKQQTRHASLVQSTDSSVQKTKLTSALGIGLMMILSSLFLPVVSFGASFSGYQITKLLELFGNFSDSPEIAIIVGLMWLMWLAAGYSLFQLHSGTVHRTSAYLSSLIPVCSILLTVAGVLFKTEENMQQFGVSLFDDPGTLIEVTLEILSAAPEVLGIGAYCMIVGSLVVLKQLRKTGLE